MAVPRSTARCVAALPRRRRAIAVSFAAAIAVCCTAAVAASPTDGLAAAIAAEDRAALVTDVERRGDAARGSTIFHTRHLTCTQCHIAGSGTSPLGPNLAALPEGVPRDRLTAHLVESLLDPSAVVRPAYRGVTIITDDGRSLSGLVARETADELVLRDAATGGRETTIPKASIEERVEQRQSLMPHGLPNLLADRRQFLDLVRYLAEVAAGGPDRAAALPPDPAVLAVQAPAAYEADIDHAGFITDWNNRKQSRAALKRGEAIYGRVCANCHGTLEAPGSLPTALRFAEGKFKHGSDPHAMYRTLTAGNGLMVAQTKLMARVGEKFPLECPACGGDIRLIAFITEPGPIRKILTHLGEPLEPPPITPARGPPTDWGELVQARDDRDVFQASPDELPAIDIHSL